MLQHVVQCVYQYRRGKRLVAAMICILNGGLLIGVVNNLTEYK